MHWEDPEGWDGAGGGRGGSGWETHINPWLIHVNVWQKSLQYCKVISLQLIKINEKKKENVPLNIAVILNFCWKQSIVSLNESLHRSHIDVLYTLNGVSLWLSGLKMGKKKKKKESSCQAGDMGSIPRLGRFSGEGNGNPLQCSCLENPMDRGAWRATVHGVAKESDTT